MFSNVLSSKVKVQCLSDLLLTHLTILFNFLYSIHTHTLIILRADLLQWVAHPTVLVLVVHSVDTWRNNTIRDDGRDVHRLVLDLALQYYARLTCEWGL